MEKQNISMNHKKKVYQSGVAYKSNKEGLEYKFR